MDDATPDATIGTGIAEVLDAAYKELKSNTAIGTKLDDIFWSSANASVGQHSASFLDNAFYSSISAEDDLMPRRVELASFDPPSGNPVVPANPAALERDTVINQVVESAMREAEKRIRLSRALPDNEGDYLLFSNGKDGIYMGRPNQYGKLYDDPKVHLKELLNRFYRGNKEELEQVAGQIVENALKGTPVDVKKWLG